MPNLEKKLQDLATRDDDICENIKELRGEEYAVLVSALANLVAVTGLLTRGRGPLALPLGAMLAELHRAVAAALGADRKALTADVLMVATSRLNSTRDLFKE